MRVPWIAAVGFALALLAGPSAARAGQCGATCWTVCQEGGCDFATIGECANGVANGSTCRVQGGVYHEFVTYSGTLPQDLVFQCADPVGAPCAIDGDSVRESAFEAYVNWTLQGFEVRNTTGDAVTSTSASRRTGSVRDCWIHDVGGVGIRNVGAGDVVERNRIERTGSHGILCGTVATSPTIVRNNLVIASSVVSGGRGISCTQAGAEAIHNTVDLRDTTSPWAGAAPYGIYATTAKYNVVAGGSAGSMYATGACQMNLAWGWGGSGSAFSGTCASDATNVTGDPGFLSVEDRRTGAGSPAIGLAADSSLATDMNGRTRSVPADAGAFEWAEGDGAAPLRWPVQEEVRTTTNQAAPAMALLPGRGPMVAWFDIRGLADGDLVVSERLHDGSWRSTVLAAGSVIPAATSPNPFLQYVDLAVDPVTGRPAVAWVDRNASNQARLRFARFLGEECATGDCTDPRWDGCGDPALATSAGAMGVAIAFPPDGDRPAVAAAREITNGCGAGATGYDVLFARPDLAGTWQVTTVEAAPCGSRVGYGIDVAFDPVTGAPGLAWARSTTAYGSLVFAEDAGTGFGPSEVSLGAGVGTAYEKFHRVSLAFADDGTLGIASTLYSSSEPDRNGFGYVQRSLAGWESQTVPVDTQAGPNSQRPYQGLDLAFDLSGQPVFVHTLGGVLHLATRDANGWDYAGLDTRDVTGLWARLALDAAGHRSLSYQQDTRARVIRFLSQTDPGGLDLPRPTTCDDGDLCTISACDPLRGCLHEPVECDDANGCTTDGCVRETGACANEPVDCSDGNRCTTDGCVPATGQCTHDPVDCDDGNRCTTDRCDGVAGCVNDTVDCDDGEPCTTDGCDPATGECDHAPTDCDDGDACTTDTCRVRFGCEHADVDCDDQDACTLDGCDRATGCRHADVDCDDADACTADSCSTSIGCRNLPVDCDDANPCTIDSCDAALGCGHVRVGCDDGDPCTLDDCDPAIGCTHVPDPCDDGNACTDDHCTERVGCVHAPADCDDQDPCTTDGCDRATGCGHEAHTGPCDDGDAGTVGDSCALGVCTGVPAVVQLPVIVERIGVRDVPAVTPPATIALVERIGVRDAPAVIPPAVVSVTERIGVAMTGTGSLDDPPPENPPEAPNPAPDVVEPSSEVVQPADTGPDSARDTGAKDPGASADSPRVDAPADAPPPVDPGTGGGGGGDGCSFVRARPAAGAEAWAILFIALLALLAVRKREGRTGS